MRRGCAIGAVFAGCVAGRGQPAPALEVGEVGAREVDVPADEDAAPAAANVADADAAASVAARLAEEDAAVSGGAGGEGTVPVVRVAPVTVGPKHPPELIRRVILRHKAEFERCWAGGAVAAAFEFTIGAGGVVTAAEARDSDGAPSTAPAHVCATGVLRSLRFPADLEGITVRYPLR